MIDLEQRLTAEAAELRRRARVLASMARVHEAKKLDRRARRLTRVINFGQQ